jgi:SulP family sulfate permease
MTTHNPINPRFQLILDTLTYALYYLLQPARMVKAWSPNFLAPDFLAGVTVGLIALPQAIAFALIANLPPEMGLYATVVAAIVGALWGSTHQIQTGPANAISILVFSSLVTVAEPGTSTYILAAGMVAVMAGLVQLTVGLTRLGVVVNFVSRSVIVGFASGAAVLIAVGQIRPLLGLNYPNAGLFQTLRYVAFSLPDIHWPTALLGLGAVGLLLLSRKVNRKLPGPLIAMITASVLVFVFNLNARGVDVIGELPRGLPPLVRLPLLDIELINQLASGALAIAAIGLIQTTAIARAIANETGQRVDNNQEFVGQGMANIAVGFFSGYPGAASFARSAVSLKAGAKTAVSAIMAGSFVMVAMLLLAPLAAYLPRAALSGVLLVIAYGLIDQEQIRRISRGAVADGIIMIVTFLGTLFFSLTFAVLSGILLSLAIYVVKTSLPRVFTVVPGKDFKHFIEPQPGNPACPQLGIFTISGDLYFGAVTHVEETLLDHFRNHPEQGYLMLRMYSVNNCDMDGVFMLEALHEACLERGGDLYFVKVTPPVMLLMESAGFVEKLGADHFLSEEKAIDYLFHRVLDPHICIYSCQYRLFFECQNLPKQLPTPAASAPIFDIPEVLPDELLRELEREDAPPDIIDVREIPAFRQGHIPQAIRQPLKTALRSPETMPINGKVVFVCHSGARSRQAAVVLKTMGHNNVRTLKGGMRAWKAASLPQTVNPWEDV